MTHKICSTINTGMGIHMVTPTITTGRITFDIHAKAGASRITTPVVIVYGDAHEARHKAAEAKATSSNGVVFTKEMSWKVDFSTDSCRQESFGQVIRTMAQVQPAQGDERVIVAKASGIVTMTSAGCGALAIAFAVGEHLPDWHHLTVILLLVFVAYGLSVYCYTYAQRTIGAAKTSTYYALAPFIGALLSILLLGEPVTLIFIVASIMMAIGCWIAAK